MLDSFQRRGALRGLCLHVVVSLCALAGTALAAATRVPGTRVALEPPEGFTPAEQFAGFQRLNPAASIMVMERPGKVLQVYSGMTKEALAGQGITLLGSEVVTLDGQAAMLYHVTQPGPGGVVEKWMVLFGDDANTVMVVAGFPQASASSMSEPMKRAVMSTTWNPAQPVDKFEGLPFRLADTASFKVASRSARKVTLTTSGVDPRRAEDPVLVIVPSVNDEDIQDLESLARQRIGATATISQVTNISGSAVKVDGATGYELTGDATDANYGTALRVYQLIVVEGRKILMVQGRVAASQAAEFAPQFSRVARSVQRKR